MKESNKLSRAAVLALYDHVEDWKDNVRLCSPFWREHKEVAKDLRHRCCVIQHAIDKGIDKGDVDVLALTRDFLDIQGSFLATTGRQNLGTDELSSEEVT